jgi:hypothetical protein
MSELSRRELLTSAAALWVSACLPRPRALEAAAASSTPSALTPAEWRSVEAIAARIVPTDHEPGASEAGAVNFIDKALAHEDAAALPRYRAALRALDLVCRSRHDAAFEALAPELQDALLRELEDGTVSGWNGGDADPAAFFATVREHAILGFLCEPARGGNRDYAGWRVVQFPGRVHELGGATPEQMLGQAPFPTAWGGEIE